ncbi:MAG: patatin-like phospholipase family protein [Elusimicrobia bacterium]|nr:patatin-like phospholipase family protein [Elusimicrobiota bacterium]
MKKIFVLSVLVSMVSSISMAVPPPATEGKKGQRPRIGLVLSGGGARGAAHVGVLKVLEELRIPVDFVAGTSMGSAVGGLFASGLTPQELDVLFADFDWNAAFSDSPPRRELSYRRKSDDRTFRVKARVGVGEEGIELPLGLVEGQNFVTELRKLSRVTQSVDSFDDLSIPFRAMATDLETGKSVILDKGDLVNAIRASIAIVPLFSPVEINGRLYVDGGYLKNVPVDVVQKMGVDRLIVVNIGTPLTKRKDIKSVLDVFSQVGRLGGQYQDERQMSLIGRDDLLIRPDLTGLSFVDFGKIPEIMKRGEDATRAIAKELAPLSLTEEDYRAWRASLKPRPQLPRVDSIEVRNGTRIKDSVLTPFISQPVGENLDPVRMQKDLARLFGLGYFECIDYHVERRDDKNVVVVNAPRKGWGPNYLKLGFKMAEDFKGHGDYGIMGRFQMTELNPLGAEFQADAVVGLNSGVSAEFYQPVGKVPRRLSYGAPYFVFTKALLQQVNQPIIINEGAREVAFRDQHSGLVGGGGRSLGNWGHARLGLSWTDQSYRTPTVPNISKEYEQGEGLLEVAVDTVDDAGFPRRGLLADVWGRATGADLGAEAPASVVGIRAMQAFSLDRHTLRLKGEWADNFNNSPENPYFQRIGGFLNLGGYSQNSLLGTQKALVQTQYLYDIGKVMGKSLHGGVAAEWGGVWDQSVEIAGASNIFSGTIFAAMTTSIGPAYFGYSRAESGVGSFYLYIGQAF